MAKVLLPLPDHDFDVTEVAVPWRLLRDAGHDVVFATEAGATPACDPLLITGVLFGKLGARPEAIAFYREMEQDPAFVAPRKWGELRADEFDSLFLAGGHAPGMKQYLGSETVQQLTARFFAATKPIAAICHGALVAARSKRADGQSVLHGHKTTCLPKYMERAAYLSTFWLRGKYYRTYPAYVEEEVRAALAAPEDFERGPREMSKRGTREDDTHAFCVDSGHYVSGRWAGRRVPDRQAADRAARRRLGRAPLRDQLAVRVAARHADTHARSFDRCVCSTVCAAANDRGEVIERELVRQLDQAEPLLVIGELRDDHCFEHVENIACVIGDDLGDATISRSPGARPLV